jgi:hypothetical protein
MPGRSPRCGWVPARWRADRAKSSTSCRGACVRSSHQRGAPQFSLMHATGARRRLLWPRPRRPRGDDRSTTNARTSAIATSRGSRVSSRPCKPATVRHADPCRRIYDGSDPEERPGLGIRALGGLDRSRRRRRVAGVAPPAADCAVEILRRGIRACAPQPSTRRESSHGANCRHAGRPYQRCRQPGVVRSAGASRIRR